MKKQILLGLVLLATAVFAGCSNDPDPDTPVIKTEGPTSYEVSYKGGEFSITYMVSKDARPYIDYDSDWIRVAESDTRNTKFVAALNPGQARTAKILISYNDAKPLEITVVQQAKPTLRERLVVTVENVMHNQFEVVCQNLEGENLWYYYIAMKKDFYDEKVAPDPKAWVIKNAQDKYASWKFLYDFGWVDDDFALYYLLTNAETDRLLFDDGISADTDYVIVAFDLDPTAYTSGEISTCTFRTKPLPPVEMIDMTFRMNIEYKPENLSHPYLLTINPSRDDNRYFYYVAPKEDYEDMMKVYGNNLDELVAAFREQFLEQDIFWKYISAGALSESWGGFEDTDGDGKISLVAIACGLDEVYRINSKAQASQAFELAFPGKSSVMSIGRAIEPRRADSPARLLERRALVSVPK